MSHRKKVLNTYTLTLKVQPSSPIWYDSAENLNLMEKFIVWIEKFQTHLVELTNCSLLMDSKYKVSSKNESLKTKDFVGAVITFKASNEDLVCEWVDELPLSRNHSWEFEILKSCELYSAKTENFNLIKKTHSL
jgi:hypothetical protein